MINTGTVEHTTVMATFAKKSTRILHWFPRILCILAILFISIFALDAFGPGRTLWQQLGDFLMHLIPSFILLGILLVAWKWEFVGGLIFTLIGIIFTPIIYMHNYRMNQSVWISLEVVLLITIPFVVVGVLFLVSYSRKKKERASTAQTPP